MRTRSLRQWMNMRPKAQVEEITWSGKSAPSPMEGRRMNEDSEMFV